MELLCTFSNRPGVVEGLKNVKTMNQGKLQVFQVYSPTKQINYALKVFPRTEYGVTQYQKEKLISKLKHKNIIQRVPAVFHNDEFHFVLTEFAKYGDFFDGITQGFLGNNEILVRTYFHQLIEGLEYMHSQGVAHLDLKLENIMLGKDFQLKIIDFDQAQNISDKEITSGGTLSYRAPEVKDGSCSDLEAADLFSVGVILYTFRAQEFPFIEEAEEDFAEFKSYEAYLNDKASFWKHKALLKNDKNFFSVDFIKLINGLLEKNPKDRFTIKDIKESKWYNGPILNELRLKSEMQLKWTNFQSKKTGSSTCKSPKSPKEEERRN